MASAPSSALPTTDQSPGSQPRVGHDGWWMPFAAAALGAAVMFVAFIFEGSKGFNLMDEGFLWYGAQRLLHGEFPLRDYMSYDPGRYYWSAMVMGLLHDSGVMVVRAATAFIGAVGVAIASLLVFQNCGASAKSGWQRWAYTLLAVCVLVLWMIPRHKLYDITTSIMLVAGLAGLLRNKDARAFFVYGLCTGMAAFIGRNHGLYAVAAGVACIPMLLLSRSNTAWSRCIPAGAIGVAVGYMPVLLSMALIPGYTAAMIDSVHTMLASASAISYPVPWPWLVLQQAQIDWQQFAVGCMYVLLAAFNILGCTSLAWNVLKRKSIGNPLFAACVVLSLPYSHHAFYYAGISHLAQGLFPFLLGSLVFLNDWKQNIMVKTPLLGSLVFLSAMATLPSHPGYQAIGAHWTHYTIGKDTLTIPRGMAADITTLKSCIEQNSSSHHFVMLPYWPAMYAMYEKPSPIFDLYAVFPRTDEFQKREIAQIAAFKPDVIVLWDYPPDAQEAWKYSNTNPLIAKYLDSDWKKTAVSERLSVYVQP